MKKQIKKQWVEALRSGEYQKGKGFLHKQHRGKDLFCALGVLCDVAGDDYWLRYENTNKWGMPINEGGKSSLGIVVLPYRIMKKVGLSLSEQTLVWRMNDAINLSFEEIADWIEENL